MRKIIFLMLLILPTLVSAQGLNVPPRDNIDYPIAWALPRASFDVHMRTFAEGGLLAGVHVGMTDRFMFGVSFGGINVLGENTIDWHPFAGASARYLLVSESFTLPAVAFGFNSQGHGGYLQDFKRFERKSTGFFLVVSKNYEVFDHLSFHLGTNYSLEDGDGDDGANLFSGLELGFSADLSLLAEYDFGLNDNDDGVFFPVETDEDPLERVTGEGHGYFNLGLRYRIKNAVYFEIHILDLLENKFEGTRRSIKLTYFELF